MAQYIVAKSIAFAFPDSSVSWDIEKSTHSGCKVTHDGIEITQGGGIYEVTLELPHTDNVDAFASIDGTILKENDSCSSGLPNGDTVAWVKYVTKIHEGSLLSVWVKNNVKGVFRDAVLTIRKLPDDYAAKH